MRARIVTAQYGLPQGVEMSAPTVDDLDVLRRRIAASWASLQGARDAYDYSPNAETEYQAVLAERRLNALLDDPRLPRKEMH